MLCRAWLLLAVSYGLERPREEEVHLAASPDPLKTWLASLQLHLPDSENVSSESGQKSYFRYHDMTCGNLKFERLISGMSKTGVWQADPILELRVQGVSIECKAKFSTTGLVWLVGGNGEFTVSLTNQNGAQFEILFDRVMQPRERLTQLERIRCDVDFDAKINILGGVAAWIADKLQKALMPFVGWYFQSQIQQKACERLDELLQVQLRPWVDYANQLFYAVEPLRRLSEKNASIDDRGAAGGDAKVDPKVDPKLYDWTQSELLQWSNWLYTKVLPPEVARELTQHAGEDFLTIDFSELHVPPFSTVVDQQNAVGMEMKVSVAVKEVQLKGFEGVQAYGVDAVGPTQLRAALELGSQEHPVTSGALKLHLHLEAVDTHSQSQATLDEEMSFSIAVKKPSTSFQIRLACGEEKMKRRQTVGQLLMDPVNCARSHLEEAPSLEWLNLTFEGLEQPLSYIPNTEGSLEKDISDLFNVLVSVFNELFEEHLPGAIARLTTSEKGMALVNQLLAKQASPAECMAPEDAQEKVKGQLPPVLNNWPELLDGQVHQYVQKIVHGLLATNRVEAPSGWLEMPPINHGALTNVNVKDLMINGTSQISALELLGTNKAEPETVSFNLKAECPSEAKDYKTSIFMTLQGTLVSESTADALVQVDLPCGEMKATLNLSVDTLEASTILMPPTLFCTVLSPFKTIEMAWLNSSLAAGEIYVQIAAGKRVAVIEELCRLHGRLCAFVKGLAAAYGDAANATRLLSYLHQEATRHCEAMLGRRLAFDVNGEFYTEFSWSSLLLCGLFSCGGAGLLTFIASLDQQSATGLLRTAGRGLIFAVGLLILLSVTFRLLACFNLAYMSITLTNVYQGKTVIDSQTLGVFTYNGLAAQLKEASWVLAFGWYLNGVGISLAVAVLLAVTWVKRWPFRVQHILLRVSLYLARQPWQELATLALTALSSTSDIQLPLELQGQQRMAVWAGAFLAMLSTISLSTAGVLMLMTIPCKSEEKSSLALLDLVLSSGMATGVLIFLAFDFVRLGMRGVAGLVFEPQSFSAAQVGDANPLVKLLVLWVFVLAPLGQALMVSFRAMGLKVLNPEHQRVIEEVCMSFNALETFVLAYYLGFLDTVDAFTSSFVERQFAVPCQTLKTLAHAECIGVDAESVTFGTLGLLLAAGCTVALYIRSSVCFHHLVSNPVRRDVEAEGQVAVELQ